MPVSLYMHESVPLNCKFQVTKLANKNIKMSSPKSSESIQMKEGGPDRSVSDNQSPSVTLNKLAMKARKDTVFRVSEGKSYIDWY